jgi:tripartite-type tricarboxylate transporter receptor subunit TctC
MTNLLRPHRRALLGATAAALLPLPARAQGAWPERNVTLIVPFAPGGASDMIARLVAEALGPRIGRAVVVENRPGGAANIGVGALARSAPDGHTIGIVSLSSKPIRTPADLVGKTVAVPPVKMSTSRISAAMPLSAMNIISGRLVVEAGW